MKRLRSVRVMLLALCLCLTAAVVMSCNKSKTEVAGGNGEQEKSTAPTAEKKSYEVFEKMLADKSGRPATTLKIVVPAGATKETLEGVLKDVQAQDNTLKAVIIWAYNKRSELNEPSFTFGKLEWSSDGKDFNNEKPLTPNPKIDMMPQKAK